MTWLDELTFNTVIVHLTDGMSFKGLRAAVYDDGLVLRDAAMVADPMEQLNGELFIPRERVSSMQIVSEG